MHGFCNLRIAFDKTSSNWPTQGISVTDETPGVPDDGPNISGVTPKTLTKHQSVYRRNGNQNGWSNESPLQFFKGILAF